jgi:ATP-dependent Clp protease protease subunit
MDMKTSTETRSRSETYPITDNYLEGEIPPDLVERQEGDTGSRIISICDEIAPRISHKIVLELLQYESANPGAPIHLYIYSPGGCVPSGLSIIDVMHHISSPVFTYCMGYAASMGAVILAGGEKGHRYILPHSRVMIHQASGAAGGTLDNVRATLAFQSALEADVEKLLALSTGKTVAEIRDVSRVDNWMDARTALSFGLVDHILSPAVPKL